MGTFSLKCTNPWAPSAVSEPFVRCMCCAPCRVWQQLQWNRRLLLEAGTWNVRPAFITLTYDNEHLPEDDEKCLVETKKFWKRVRRRFTKVRYFLVTEAGSNFGRLHHHAIVWFPGSPMTSNIALYRQLKPLWKAGFIWVEYVKSPKALRYTAKYVQKEALRYSWSQSPVIGGYKVARWKELCESLHAKEPFEDWLSVPRYMNLNVFGKSMSVQVPERDFRRLMTQMGVQFAPDEHALFRVMYSGVPSGPVRRELANARKEKKTETFSERNSANAEVRSNCPEGLSYAPGYHPSDSYPELTTAPLFPESASRVLAEERQVSS